MDAPDARCLARVHPVGVTCDSLMVTMNAELSEPRMPASASIGPSYTLFSPGQVFLAGCLGGLPACGFLLLSNYGRLGHKPLGVMVLLWGLGTTAVFQLLVSSIDGSALFVPGGIGA